MGLDMYLTCMQKIEGWNSSDYNDLIDFFNQLDQNNLQQLNLKEHLQKPNIEKVIVHKNPCFDPSKFYFWPDEKGLMEWRKANQIHKWFVENIQNGKDDCGYYLVEKSHLQQLYQICVEICHNIQRASELLPTQDGFFFGSTDYDINYMYDVNYTIEKLEVILKTFDFENNVILYTSSW